MGSLNIVLILLCGNLIFSGTYGGLQQNWLKVITMDGKEFSVTSRQCFGGIWTPKPIQAWCVCVSGIWAISKEFCDDDFEILTGDQHCFPIKRLIRKFSYIGSYWNQPRWFGNYIFRKDMPYVARFNSESSEYLLNDSARYVMRVNMSSTFRSHFDGSQPQNEPDEICIPESRPRNRLQDFPLIEISVLEGRNVFKLGPKNDCSGRKTVEPIVSMKPGQSWKPKCGEVRQSSSIYPSCRPSKLVSASTRSALKKPKLRPTTLKPRRRSTKRIIAWWVTRPPVTTPKTRPSSTTTTPLPTTVAPIIKTTTSKYLIKLPSKELLWTPLKPKPVNIKFPENSKSNDVDYEDDDRDSYWDGNFPAAEKNQLILEQTRRILSMHLRFLTHGTKAMWIDREEFGYLRIAKNILLKTCPEVEVPKSLVNAVIRLFRYALYESMEVYPYTEFTDKDEDSRINNSLSQCYESAYKMSFLYNVTSCSSKQKVILKAIHNSEEYNATIPDTLASSNTTLDFVLESVWKIMLHTHYYCAKNFAINPADLSSLMMKWEAFFSPVLKYRWANPEGSWNLFRVIFQQFNLDNFDAGLSKCLATANAVSHYPVWVQRPILKTSSKSKSSKIRGKRATREGCLPDQWNNQGYCLQKFFEPVRKYGAEAPEACLREYNGRHDL